MINVEKVNAMGGDQFIAALREEVLKELKENCAGQLQRLSRVSNGEVSYSWLIAFTSGRLKASTNASLLKVAKYLGVESTPDGKLVATGKHFNPRPEDWDATKEKQACPSTL